MPIVARTLAAAMQGDAYASNGCAAGRASRWGLRAVMVRGEDDAWHAAAIVVRPGRGDDLLWGAQQRVDVVMGQVRLLGVALAWPDPPSAPSDPLATLLALLRDAGVPKTALDAEGVAGWQAVGADVWRVPGRNRWLNEPCWLAAVDVSRYALTARAALSPHGPTLPPSLPPARRLFNAEHRLYFEDLPDAVAGWCRDGLLAQRVGQSSRCFPHFQFVIPDRHAWLTSVRRTDAGVLVQGDGTFVRTDGAELYCVATLDSLEDRRERTIYPLRPSVPVASPPRAQPAWTVEVAVHGLVEAVGLTLFGADGIEYDHGRAKDLGAPIDTELLTDVSPAADTRHCSLAEARRRGEGDLLEFKPFISLTRGRDGRDKPREVLETAAAFANTRGGSLFFGVDDHGEVVGLAGGLAAEYGAVARDADDANAREDARAAAYAAALRRLIREGVAPTLEPRVRWHREAGLLVLELAIGRGAHGPYEITDRSDFYVRRGATNVRASRSELREMFDRGGWSPGGR